MFLCNATTFTSIADCFPRRGVAEDLLYAASHRIPLCPDEPWLMQPRPEIVAMYLTGSRHKTLLNITPSKRKLTKKWPTR